MFQIMTDIQNYNFGLIPFAVDSMLLNYPISAVVGRGNGNAGYFNRKFISQVDLLAIRGMPLSLNSQGISNY